MSYVCKPSRSLEVGLAKRLTLLHYSAKCSCTQYLTMLRGGPAPHVFEDFGCESGRVQVNEVTAHPQHALGTAALSLSQHVL